MAPKETVEAGVKLAPVMVTAVAPVSGPEVGAMAVTVGMDPKVNRSPAVVAETPPAVVTVRPRSRRHCLGRWR